MFISPFRYGMPAFAGPYSTKDKEAAIAALSAVAFAILVVCGNIAYRAWFG